MAKNKKVREPSFRTKRLIIPPMSNEELRALAESGCEDAAAYAEMLAGCEAHPENRIWYTAWKACLKKEGSLVGDLCFKGPVENNSVEIGYGFLKEYRGQGYATEAVTALRDWAFTNEGCYYVEAETAPDNAASQRVLEKAGFVRIGLDGAEGPRFVAEAPTPSWTSIYLLFGLSIGTSIGTSMGSIGIGMCLGIAIGMAIGAGLDQQQKKKRAEIAAARQNRLFPGTAEAVEEASHE